MTTDQTHFIEVRSSYQRRPAYRYLRASDKIPTYAELGGVPFDQITARVRLFNPTGRGTWYVCAYDPDTGNAWGVAELFAREVGDFSMSELVNFRGRFGLPIERDIHYTPVSLADVLKG